MPTTTLPSLLGSKGPLLSYSIPLLLASTLVAISGTFLTLDRTRSFIQLEDQPKRVDFSFSQPKSSTKVQGSIPGGSSEWETILRSDKSIFKTSASAASAKSPTSIWRTWSLKNWRLQGGIGGLIGGLLFGFHLTTVLTLFVDQHTGHSLQTTAFLVISYLTAVVCSLLAGRFYTIALVFTTIGGCFGLTVLMTLTVQLPVEGRAICFLVLSALLLIAPALILLPSLTLHPILDCITHWVLRVSFSCFGTFGVLLSVGLLANVEEWGDCVSALWNTNLDLGGSKALGLTILGWTLVFAGVVVDWVLWRLLGASKDEEWDRYLADYMNNLPHRAGHFEKIPSFWSKLSSLCEGKTGTAFPRDKPVSYRPAFFIRHSPPKSKFSHVYTHMYPSNRKKQGEVRFNLEPIVHDRDAEKGYDALPLVDPPHKGDATSTDSALNASQGNGISPEWSMEGYERDIANARKELDSANEEWKPEFLKRHISLSQGKQ